MEQEPNDATPFLPEKRTLSALREAAAGCRGCHLYGPAIQTVFGEGLKRSRIMFVGEQPGDSEDRQGRPFVGPAGKELDRGLEAAGIDRDDAYVTNVVKHFKFEERGRRRVWLWAASGLLIVHWLGDSLDGTLARVRKIERPTYGYYLDHLVDALATAVIGLGLGLSPYMLLSVGLVIVIVYLVLSINTYLETYAFGVFTLGYGRLGPTEARLGLILLNTLLALGVGLGFTVGDLGLTLLDLIALGIAGLMLATLVARAAGNLRVLAEREPAGRPRARVRVT